MSKLKLLSAALIAAAMLATPALARENHMTSRHADANTTIGVGYNDWRACYGNRASGLRGELCGYGDRDEWGHSGGYYGPMIGGPL